MWPNSPSKVVPLVVADLEQAVLDAEGVVVVLAEIVLGELRRPAVEVLAVEQLDPVLGSAASGARRARTGAPAAAIASAPAASARTRGAAASRRAAGAVMRAPVGVYRPAAYN